MVELKRNLLYWGRVFEGVALNTLFGIFVYILVLFLLNGATSMDEVGGMILAYGILFVCISIFSSSSQVLAHQFKLTVSMGSTRKASFMGMQIMLHTVTFQWIMIVSVVSILLDVGVGKFLCTIGMGMVGAVFGLLAFANLFCALRLRFGKVASTISYVLIIVSIIVAAIIAGVTGVLDQEGIWTNVLSLFGSPLFMVPGVFLDGLAIGWYYQLIRKTNL